MENIQAYAKCETTKLLAMHSLFATFMLVLPTWKCAQFFVDTTFSSIENFNDAINLINNEAESLKVLGIYKNQMKW